MQRTFASDNYAGIHPEVLAAIAQANVGHAPSYGADPVTSEAIELFREHFGQDAEVFFTFNGTGANVVGLQSLLRPFEAVICAESAHINVDECGAPERFLGSKLIPVATRDGKLTPELVDLAVTGTGDEHRVQPRVVSITQATEVGTCYSVEEVAALGRSAHDRGMWLHLDGARLSNAAAHLGVGLGAFGSGAGVDVLSFGATKNGAMGAEAVVSFGSPGQTSLRFIRKQSMQLASKMRFVAAQFKALLSDDLWRGNADHANRMASRLAAGVARMPGVTITYPVEANGVFATLPAGVTEQLQIRYPFYVWDPPSGVVRWMTSFDTTEQDVDEFVALVATLMADNSH
ncbi:MAG TPA: low specificity L-threonine aldolase [Acidimicrobiales bacterium]